jgi:hypothetical protein
MPSNKRYLNMLFEDTSSARPSPEGSKFALMEFAVPKN